MRAVLTSEGFEKDCRKYLKLDGDGKDATGGAAIVSGLMAIAFGNEVRS